VGYSKFFMYSGHGEFHEYSNFMKVMLVVYFEPIGFWVKAGFWVIWYHAPSL
jgi:hypothetical protein